MKSLCFEVKQHFDKRFELIHKNFKEAIKLTKNESKEKGKKQGEKIGRKEEKLEIAKAMLLKGHLVDDIVALTGLSVTQIEQVK